MPTEPLTDEEQLRAVRTFADWISRQLAEKGAVSVSADTTEQRNLFQAAASLAGEILQLPVMSYANDRRIFITLNQDELTSRR